MMFDSGNNAVAAVAVIVTHDDQVLIGQRIIDATQFRWQLPGGWMQNGESPDIAARREVDEETGLKLNNLRLVAVTNNVFSTQNHSISLCFEAECCNPNELTNREPEKCLGWQWKKWPEISDNLFLPLAILKKTDYRPFIHDKCEVHTSF